MRRLALLLPLVLSACAFTADTSPRTLRSLPAGQYQLQQDHASLLVRVTHLGLSSYTFRLPGLDATLDSTRPPPPPRRSPPWSTPPQSAPTTRQIRSGTPA